MKSLRNKVIVCCFQAFSTLWSKYRFLGGFFGFFVEMIWCEFLEVLKNFFNQLKHCCTAIEWAKGDLRHLPRSETHVTNSLPESPENPFPSAVNSFLFSVWRTTGVYCHTDCSSWDGSQNQQKESVLISHSEAGCSGIISPQASLSRYKC